MPKVPIMICYWGTEDELSSTLNLFFDKSADDNLQNESLFTLCTGLALMFEKLSQRHAAFTDSFLGCGNETSFAGTII